MNEIEYIDTYAKLDKLCQRIKQQPWIAVDTEFLREKTYFPKFCLLQIATPEWVACIDPLALTEMKQIFEIFNNSEIIKVFHSCRQDLEIFYHLTGEVPGPIFDTQLAAPLLGYQDNPGYGMLVSSMLNINLNKAYTRTDWSIRPLSAQQLQYAADDVVYLGKIYLQMRKALADLGRLAWLTDDFAALAEPQLYLVAPENAWLRIKGKNKLTGRQLSALQHLSKWREEVAQQNDRPRNWLIRDDMLIELAKLQPESMPELYNVRGINERTIKRYGDKICRLLSIAKQRPAIKLEDKKRAAKRTQQQEAVIDILSAIVRIRAEQNSLNPSILASRKDLELFVLQQEECVLLHGWRYSMVGKELLEIIQGRKLLSLQANSLNIIET